MTHCINWQWVLFAVIAFGMYFYFRQRKVKVWRYKWNRHVVVPVCTIFFLLSVQSLCTSLVGGDFFLHVLALILQEFENSLWGDVAYGVSLDLQCKMILGLVGRKCMGCIPERALSTCLTFSQPQSRNIVEYHFGVDLHLWIELELKRVLKVKLKFVLEFKSQVCFWKKKHYHWQAWPK